MYPPRFRYVATEELAGTSAWRFGEQATYTVTQASTIYYRDLRPGDLTATQQQTIVQRGPREGAKCTYRDPHKPSSN